MLHMPLVDKGMRLKVIEMDGDVLCPVNLHVPFRNLVLTRADVLHGGCFGPSGNARYHCVISKSASYPNKLATMKSMRNVDLGINNLEEIFPETQTKLCEEDPDFVASVLKAGSDLSMNNDNLACLKV